MNANIQHTVLVLITALIAGTAIAGPDFTVIEGARQAARAAQLAAQTAAPPAPRNYGPRPQHVGQPAKPNPALLEAQRTR
ncbi:hypothetical protein [Cupriavidus oxalaticus]|uniref:DUF4148 domain-containing protein n=1 Tax=Cupriavidus oxalaticus TaxID=96344 RepID=A0A4P7LGQ3_9BURK|nr:hypothetical protein [Cupriavidus oxalaticus]QBY55270.1 hypothetical protein E0W60_29660 [Cupriavidus oxalaticus]